MCIHDTWKTEARGKRQETESLPDIQIQIEPNKRPSHRKQNKTNKSLQYCECVISPGMCRSGSHTPTVYTGSRTTTHVRCFRNFLGAV